MYYTTIYLGINICLTIISLCAQCQLWTLNGEEFDVSFWTIPVEGQEE